MERLASRKFLVVVAGLALVATAPLTGAEASHIVTLVLAYVGVEGGADAVTRWRTAEPEGSSA